MFKVKGKGGQVVAILLTALILLFAYTYWGTNAIAVKKYRVAIAGLPPAFDGFTILHLSDLHNKEYGHRQGRLLEVIGRQEFDLIAITGDIIDKRKPRLAPVEELIGGLGEEEIFFVPGNHEHWAGYGPIKAALEGLGVKTLENEGIRYERAGDHIWLLGVDDPYTGKDRLDEALGVVNDARPRVLLAHAPDIFPAAAEAGLELVLVGHTHGGQIRLPFVGAVLAPGQGLLPHYDYGPFTEGGTTMIVNGGLGESLLPVRFNLRPEIVSVTLVAI